MGRDFDFSCISPLELSSKNSYLGYFKSSNNGKPNFSITVGLIVDQKMEEGENNAHSNAIFTQEWHGQAL